MLNLFNLRHSGVRSNGPDLSRKKRVIYVILVTMLFFSCSQQKVISTGEAFLTQKLEENTQQSYSFEIIIQNSSVIKGNTRSSTTNVNFEITNRINRIDSDTLHVTTSIDELEGSVKTSRGMQQIPDLDKLKGDSIQVAIYPDGDVELTNAEEEENQMLSILKSTLSNLYGFMPEKKMKVGEKWQDESEEKGVSSKTSYTLSGFVHNKKWGEVCTIESKSEITQINDVTRNNMKIHSESSGTSKGTIYCSVDTGIVTKIKSHAALEGTSQITGNPMMDDMTIPTYVNIDSVIERIK